MPQLALVTGAYGYLGSLIRDRLEDAGWDTIALVREPRAGDRAIRWRLGEAPAAADLIGARALVHCAYDFHPRSPVAARQVNVEGTARLLRAAGEARVPRSLVLSSMSAWPGTRQTYGQVKLAIEAETRKARGIAVRPGLVYGPGAGGMAATLTKLARLPVTPDLGPGARQFPVHEDDLAAAVVAILEDPGWRSEVFGIAQPRSVGFRTLVSNLASGATRPPRFVRTPWQLAYGSLRAAELLRLSSLRADSIIGLIRPAPEVRRSVAFPGLLSELREMTA